MQIKFIWHNCTYQNGEWGQPAVHSFWLEGEQIEIEKNILSRLDKKQTTRYDEVKEVYRQHIGFLISGDLKSIWAMPRSYPYSDHWEDNPFTRVEELNIKTIDEITSFNDFIIWLSRKDITKHDGFIKKPFEKSYWVVPEMFLAGYYPGSTTEERTIKKLNSLLDSGIRCIINLMEPDEYSTENVEVNDYTETLVDLAKQRDIELKIYNFHIRDLSIPSIEQMRKILNIIDKNLYGDIKRPVYVHCRGGIGRTGTVVGCWLKEHNYNSNEKSVLEFLDNIREIQIPSKYLYDSPETDEQKNFVLNWGE